MKKIILLLVIIATSLMQLSAQCNFQLTDNWSSQTVCSPTNVTVSGVTMLAFRATDGGMSPCAGGTITIQLQRFNGSTWPVQQSVTRTMSNFSPAVSQSYSLPSPLQALTA